MESYETLYLSLYRRPPHAKRTQTTPASQQTEPILPDKPRQDERVPGKEDYHIFQPSHGRVQHLEVVGREQLQGAPGKDKHRPCRDNEGHRPGLLSYGRRAFAHQGQLRGDGKNVPCQPEAGRFCHGGDHCSWRRPSFQRHGGNMVRPLHRHPGRGKEQQDFPKGGDVDNRSEIHLFQGRRHEVRLRRRGCHVQ